MVHTRVQNGDELKSEIDAFKPDVIHGHYLVTTDVLALASEMAGVPFTVRTHSFDVLSNPADVGRWTQFVNRSSCLAVLCFPFLRTTLAAAGVDESKLVECWPVVDYRRFYDTSPNGEEVINSGACLPKKNMESYIRLAALVPQRRFNLYPIGYFSEEIADFNRSQGSPVHIHRPVEPYRMAEVYKRNQWLVYSMNPDVPTVGWPLSIAEAQAAGVGVAVQRIRPDIETYVGEAGYVFDTLEEAAEIVASPFSEERRQVGFRHAKRSDVSEHIRLLWDVWAKGGISGATYEP